ncbi:acyl-coenzyme A synthetase/AMP-(fatty) acid ligase [Pseudoclavibacter sp. JAI123]|uniref:hypothetical protein n=1 Tax=Pseudoclavibacter sp. JAI123 TaxID=2723065 RepID=UPI0015CAA063|nr:hypothetical protein [Pseudoclavibacter sp. JAI123]NYF12012.1 acyl-coenzyme A synthetase/AMP-(fatty) acid ligase [Pseudoclavibacter sp. JAI123]
MSLVTVIVDELLLEVDAVPVRTSPALVVPVHVICPHLPGDAETIGVATAVARTGAVHAAVVSRFRRVGRGESFVMQTSPALRLIGGRRSGSRRPAYRNRIFG